MMLLLVRHAVALRRRAWTRPDHLRPLTPKGHAQAEALIGLLAPFEIERILSSPFVRCVETVEPLAAKLGVPIEHAPQLAEGADRAAAALVSSLTGPTVFCSHGDVVPALLGALAPSVLQCRPDGALAECAKASTWVIASDGSARRAQYLPPPVTSGR